MNKDVHFPAQMRSYGMCDKCRELDTHILEYQRQIRSSRDLREVESLQAEIRKLIGQKIDFHARPAR